MTPLRQDYEGFMPLKYMKEKLLFKQQLEIECCSHLEKEGEGA